MVFRERQEPHVRQAGSARPLRRGRRAALSVASAVVLTVGGVGIPSAGAAIGMEHGFGLGGPRLGAAAFLPRGEAGATRWEPGIRRLHEIS